MLSVCVYCKKSPPDVTPSEAHIFPYALGGTESSREIVCVTCNGRINRDVETPALPSFRVFQSLHGIEGRRGRVPGVAATAKIEGYEARVSLGPDGRPTGPVVRVETDGQGRKTYVVYGTDEMIQTIAEAITRAHPGVKWSQSKYDVPVEVFADGPSVGGPIIRRLAAKVAFERFAQLRGDVIAADAEFDVIREFILTGAEPQPCCGITADPRLLTRSFNLPVPAHAVVIVFHEADRLLGGFVMLFGLFLYWVILSRRYRALGSVDDLLVEWPHIREVERPLLRSGLGAIRVPWNEYVRQYTRDPDAVARAANQAARLKFQAAVDAAYGPRTEGRSGRSSLYQGSDRMMGSAAPSRPARQPPHPSCISLQFADRSQIRDRPLPLYPVRRSGSQHTTLVGSIGLVPLMTSRSGRWTARVSAGLPFS